jgi:D-alanyl-D-alanine carboxypeptidase
VRTAAAITEDVGAAVDEAPEAPVARRVERVAVAERAEPIVERAPDRAIDNEETASIEPEEVVAPARHAPRVAAAPVPAAPIPAPTHAKIEKPTEKAVRPAFVSGVQKRVAEETTAGKKKNAKDLAKQQLAAIADGSTSSRQAGKAVITAATTTPSAIRSTAVAKADGKADAARPTKPGWMIQIGAAEDPEKANALLSRARSQLSGFPTTARAFTEKVQKGNETLYRARFAGLEEQSAQSACKTLKKSGFACFTTKN